MDAAQLLLQNGADDSIRNNDKKTALEMTKNDKMIEIFKTKKEISTVTKDMSILEIDESASTLNKKRKMEDK